MSVVPFLIDILQVSVDQPRLVLVQLIKLSEHKHFVFVLLPSVVSFHKLLFFVEVHKIFKEEVERCGLLAYELSKLPLVKILQRRRVFPRNSNQQLLPDVTH